MGSAFPRSPGDSDGTGILAEALGPVLAVLLADPTVTAAMANHDGSVWVERDGGPPVPVPGAAVPQAELERMAGALAALAEPKPRHGQPILVEDPGAGLAASALPGSRLRAPSIAVRRLLPPRLDGLVAAGRVGAEETGRLRDLLHGAGHLLVAGPAARPRRTVVCTLLAEAAALGQRILHVRGTERFPVPVPNLVALAAPPGLRTDLEAPAVRLRPDRLVFSALTVATQPWLLDWATGRRLPVVVTVQASRPGDVPGRLARQLGGQRRSGAAAMPVDFVDAAVFVASPGAPWRIRWSPNRAEQRGKPGSGAES